MAVAGMDHQPRRFVDHQQVVVLIDNVEGNRLRHDFESAALIRHHYGDDIERLDLVIGLDHISVHAHIIG